MSAGTKVLCKFRAFPLGWTWSNWLMNKSYLQTSKLEACNSKHGPRGRSLTVSLEKMKVAKFLEAQYIKAN